MKENTAFRVTSHFTALSDISLAYADCMDFLATIPTGSTQLVMTSPPYNMGKEYEPKLQPAQYLEFLKAVIAEAVRIVRPGGSICFQVGSYRESRSEVKPLAFLLDPIFSSHKEEDIKFRNAIIWHFEHGRHAEKRFSGRYEQVLWYSKGDVYTFNLDEVRVPQRYQNKRHFKGPKKGLLSCNPLGKNPGDVWTDIPNVKAKHPEKTEHPCQFPVALASRLIRSLSDPGDLIVDPFAGVGTTLVAAALTGRRSAGCDNIKKYVEIASSRIRDAAAGSLIVREDRPIQRSLSAQNPQPRAVTL